MKIACIGNMNNMMFTLCRYLRDYNMDAHLFLFNDEAGHFLPGADTYDEKYKAYTATLPVGRANLFQVKQNRKKLKEIFSGFDFFIGTDLAPALMALIGKQLDVFVPHGTDIYHFPFITKPDKTVNKIYWARSIYLVGLLQKIGAQQAPVILFPDEYDIHFPFKKKLNCKGKFHNTSAPMVYATQYHDPAVKALFKNLGHYHLFETVRNKYNMVVFSHSRQNGFDLEGKERIHYKGNDSLIKGFSGFVKQHPSVSAGLVLFEYGMNVKASKDLVISCGIEDKVIWMPKMDRKEIMAGLMTADIGCGIFGSSWLTCGVVNEVLAVGKPLLHFRDDSLYVKDYASLYSLLNAHSAAEITAALSKYVAQTEKIKNESTEGTAWLEKYTVEQPLGIIGKAVQAQHTKGGRRLGFATRVQVKIMLAKAGWRSAWYRLRAKLG